jgi:hypothetical protein
MTHIVIEPPIRAPSGQGARAALPRLLAALRDAGRPILLSELAERAGMTPKAVGKIIDHAAGSLTTWRPDQRRGSIRRGWVRTPQGSLVGPTEGLRAAWEAEGHWTADKAGGAA